MEDEFLSMTAAVSWLAFGKFSTLWPKNPPDDQFNQAKVKDAVQLLLNALRSDKIKLQAKANVTDDTVVNVPVGYLLNQDIKFDFAKNELGRRLPDELLQYSRRYNDWKLLQLRKRDVYDLVQSHAPKKDIRLKSTNISKFYSEEELMEYGRAWMRTTPGSRVKFRKALRENWRQGQKMADHIFARLNKELGVTPGRPGKHKN